MHVHIFLASTVCPGPRKWWLYHCLQISTNAIRWMMKVDPYTAVTSWLPAATPWEALCVPVKKVFGDLDKHVKVCIWYWCSTTCLGNTLYMAYCIIRHWSVISYRDPLTMQYHSYNTRGITETTWKWKIAESADQSTWTGLLLAWPNIQMYMYKTLVFFVPQT